MAVYANAYFARIHDCLRDDFGALARALGAAGFHDLVKPYLMMHPPTRSSLRHVGAHLAEHLASEPFASIFARRCGYAHDLARLEWALAEAFFAADAGVLSRCHLAAVPPEAWAELRFEMTPSLQLVICHWPVHRIRERFEQETAETFRSEAPSLPAEPTHLRVWRQEDRVRCRAIPAVEYEALSAAAAGQHFAAICEGISQVSGEADPAARAASLLSSWVSDGLLAGIY